VNLDRLSPGIIQSLERFITTTVDAWMTAGTVTVASYAVEILATDTLTGWAFDRGIGATFGATHPSAQHSKDVFIQSAHGKSVISMVTGLDSHEAIRLKPGLMAQLDGGFPWGGAIVDREYGLIVATSGFEAEDEDILVSRTVLSYLRRTIDRAGEAMIDAARRRGELGGEAGADRFTRRPTAD